MSKRTTTVFFILSLFCLTFGKTIILQQGLGSYSGVIDNIARSDEDPSVTTTYIILGLLASPTWTDLRLADMRC